mmetsp:Transcript_8287/g.21313  ORF Transcript_8287/g.21313 Transcript_8287/m.21313 type:complete len:262 (-) Transcript_8287:158-943(-)
MVAGNEEVLHEFQEHALRGVAVRITRNQLCNGGVRVLGQAGHVRELRVWVDHAIVADRVARNLKVAWPLALVEECLEAIPIGAILVRVLETIIHTFVHADHVVVCLLIRRKPCLFRALFEANNVEVLCQEVAIGLVQHRAIHPTNVTLVVNGRDEGSGIARGDRLPSDRSHDEHGEPIQDQRQQVGVAARFGCGVVLFLVAFHGGVWIPLRGRILTLLAEAASPFLLLFASLFTALLLFFVVPTTLPHIHSPNWGLVGDSA